MIADEMEEQMDDEMGNEEPQMLAGGSIVDIDMTAKQWDFEPSTVRVREGQTVRLHITSIDVDHGIKIPEFEVNEKLTPGEKVDIEFVADKKGTFPFFCNVQCGSGHRIMTGELVVE